MKKAIALLLASSLAGCRYPPGNEPPGPVPNNYPGSDGIPVATAVMCDRPSPGFWVIPPPSVPGSAIPGATPLQTVYHATLPNGSLICGYWDAIHWPAQPLKPGDGQVAGTTAIIHAPAGDGAFKLGLTAPSPIKVGADGFPVDTASVGLFSTDVDFGPGAVFSVRVAFQNPCGPHLAAVPGGLSNAWAVTIAAREGDEKDLGTDRRLGVTFKVRNNGATLNVLETGADDALATDKVDPKVYDAIFGNPETCGTGHKPFTLTLYVNRQTGSGVASLAGPAVEGVKDGPLDLPFKMHLFGTSGPVIETVGATLANCCSEGGTVSVEVTDFEIKQLLRSPFGPFEPNVPNPPPINPY